MSDNTNLLSPLVDSIYECGSLLWKLISSTVKSNSAKTF